MLRPQRLEHEVDPGPIQIQPRKVHFDFSDSPLHWIPGHPVASDMVGILNVVLPAAERWFVAVYNEVLPLVKDPKLAEDMRGFMGQEAIHADVHEQALHEFMEERGFDPSKADVDALISLIGHAPRRYEDFVREMAAEWSK